MVKPKTDITKRIKALLELNRKMDADYNKRQRDARELDYKYLVTKHNKLNQKSSKLNEMGQKAIMKTNYMSLVAKNNQLNKKSAELNKIGRKAIMNADYHALVAKNNQLNKKTAELSKIGQNALKKLQKRVLAAKPKPKPKNLTTQVAKTLKTSPDGKVINPYTGKKVTVGSKTYKEIIAKKVAEVKKVETYQNNFAAIKKKLSDKGNVFFFLVDLNDKKVEYIGQAKSMKEIYEKNLNKPTYIGKIVYSTAIQLFGEEVRIRINSSKILGYPLGVAPYDNYVAEITYTIPQFEKMWSTAKMLKIIDVIVRDNIKLESIRTMTIHDLTKKLGI